VHEHIARGMYYLSVHLLYASIVATAAWVLTSIRGASATAKYWIWVVTAFNFILPVGAVIDKLWALHLSWAAPLGAIGGPVWDMTQGRSAVALGGPAIHTPGHSVQRPAQFCLSCGLSNRPCDNSKIPSG